MGLQMLALLSLFLCSSATKFQGRDGRQFECVDIYKQPSLQHPLLKDHKIQIKSTSYSSGSKLCPKGMVPIHKSRNSVKGLLSSTGSDDYLATLDTKSDSGTYHGAGAILSVHNPPLKGKFSKSQIWIENGSPEELNSIQFGWAINPELYGDSMSRLTIYWTGDGSKNTGCYNVKCQGFVQDFSDMYPGKAYDPVSTYGGQQVVANLSVYQDRSTGHWWLTNRGLPVGYWPKELFTHLQNGASSIRYGAVSSESVAPMGNGQFPDGNNDLSKSAYFKSISYVDADFNSVPINEEKMSVNTQNPKCFPLNYLKDGGQDIGQAFTYGSPGGPCTP